jgi:hypothetical protein
VILQLEKKKAGGYVILADKKDARGNTLRFPMIISYQYRDISHKQLMSAHEG